MAGGAPHSSCIFQRVEGAGVSMPLWRSFLEAAEKLTPVTVSRDHRTSACSVLSELQAEGPHPRDGRTTINLVKRKNSAERPATGTASSETYIPIPYNKGRPGYKSSIVRKYQSGQFLISSFAFNIQLTL